MRKLVVLLLALCLLSTMIFAASADSELATYDFKFFTLDVPEDIDGNFVDPVSGQAFMALYPDYNESELFHTNINCVWLDAIFEFPADEAEHQEFAENILAETLSGLAAQNVVASNGNIIETSFSEYDGLDTLFHSISYEADYSGLGLDLQTELYTAQVYVANEAFGTLIFSATADNQEELQGCMDILDTIKWN